MRSLSTMVVSITTVHTCVWVVGLMVVSICALRVTILNLACVKLPHFINITILAAKLMLSVRNKGHRKASPSRGRGADGSKQSPLGLILLTGGVEFLAGRLWYLCDVLTFRNCFHSLSISVV